MLLLKRDFLKRVIRDNEANVAEGEGYDTGWEIDFIWQKGKKLEEIDEAVSFDPLAFSFAIQRPEF